MTTPYQPQTDPTRVVGRRIVGYLIDAFIGLAIVGALFASTVDTFDVPGDVCADSLNRSESSFQMCSDTIGGTDYIAWTDGETSTILKTGDTTGLWLVGLLYWALIGILLQGLTGFTPGKAVVGLRTVDEQGNACGMGKAALRTILWVVDGIGCCVPMVAPIAAYSSKGHRRVGDMVAKTFVVPKDVMGTGPIVVAGLTPPAGMAPYAPSMSGPYLTPGAPVSPDPYAAPAATAAAGGEQGPQWDAQRNAYIQWDPARQEWQQFDDATQQWRSIQ